MEKKLKNKTQEDKKLFGTDGIRGTVDKFPLDKKSLITLGYSIRKALLNTAGAKILVGTDTRKSCRMISSLIAAGPDFFHCGVIPTPELSFLTRKHNFDFGIMITASHNPFQDNGIKIFNNKGEKISAAVENQIENIFFENTKDLPIPENRSNNFDNSDYLTFITNLLKKRISHKIIFDCANGATSYITEKIVSSLNLNAQIINNEPDGININLNCGSENPQNLQKAVMEQKADLGIAFDGDGDRVIFIDPAGNILNGDFIALILANNLFKDPNLKKEVVGTLMSNLGFEKALNKKNILLHRTNVGDKYIYQKLKQSGLLLGAEQSGHIINKQYQNTGDGILTFILFLEALDQTELQTNQIFHQFEVTPQSLVNIPVKDKKPLENWDELQSMISDFDSKYSDNSRILIRYSGTENLIRIMIESFDQNIVKENMKIFQKYIIKQIGVN